MTVEIDRTMVFSSPKQSSPLGLYLGAFCFAFQCNAAIVATPWLVMKLGGQELAVGSVGMLSMGMYLLACLLTGARFGRLGAKRLSTASAFLTSFILALTPLMPSVGLVLSLVAVNGLIMSCFWPPIMGWISAGMNGTQLNRRLSFFNLSWSSGAIMGCLLGGILFKITPWLAFAVSAGMSFLAACFISMTAEIREDAGTGDAGDPDADTLIEREPGELAMFRWISRLGLALTWIAFAALRVPIASLLKELSLDARLHAASSAGMSFIMLCFFFLLGRWAGWHYRFRMVVFAHFLLMAVLVGVGLCQNPGLLLTLICLSAPAFAFLYSSHLYYSVSGVGSRRNGAALHEILLAVGFSIGSIGTGALGHCFGSMRNVYLVVAGVVLLTLILQTGILLVGRRRKRSGLEIEN